jgi:Mono-functional DNA-alkylating methyl methanesulfonate N-term
MEANPAASLTYLSSQVVYLASCLNDSQLLRIHSAPFKRLESPTLPLPPDFETLSLPELDAHRHEETRQGSGKVVSSSGCYVELLESYTNLAPIYDAVLFDPNNSGQVRTYDHS